VGAVTAAAVYWPWYRFVEAHGSYAALLAHHRGYLGGIESWGAHWALQMAQGAALGGASLGVPWSALAWGLAIVGAFLGSGVGLPLGRNLATPVMLMIVSLPVFALIPGAGWWLAVAWLTWAWRDPRPSSRLLAVFWLVPAVLTPFYHPYARLWLPLHAAGWLIGAGLVVELVRGQAEPAAGSPLVPRPALERPLTRLGILAAVLLAACGVTTSWVGWVSPRSDLLGPRDGLRRGAQFAVDRLEELATSGAGGRLRVASSPSLLYYLAGRVHLPMVREGGIATLREARSGGGLALFDTLAFEGATAHDPQAPADPQGWLTQGLATELPGWRSVGTLDGPSWQNLGVSAATALDVWPEDARGGDVFRPRYLLILEPNP
jgi:hypothetical protein